MKKYLICSIFFVGSSFCAVDTSNFKLQFLFTQLETFAKKTLQSFKRPASTGSLLGDIEQGTKLKTPKPKEKSGIGSALGGSSLVEEAKKFVKERKGVEGVSEEEWGAPEKYSSTLPKEVISKQPTVKPNVSTHFTQKPELPAKPTQQSTQAPAAPRKAPSLSGKQDVYGDTKTTTADIEKQLRALYKGEKIDSLTDSNLAGILSRDDLGKVISLIKENDDELNDDLWVDLTKKFRDYSSRATEEEAARLKTILPRTFGTNRAAEQAAQQAPDVIEESKKKSKKFPR